MIFQITRYVDEEGKNLNKFVQADAKDGEIPITKYQGIVHLETPMGMIPIEFPFSADIKTLEDAFAVFEKTAEAFIEKMKDEAPRIIRPGSA